MKTKKIFLILIYTFILFLSGCIQTDTQQSNITKHEQPTDLGEGEFRNNPEDGSTTLGLGMQANGFYDLAHNRVASNSILKPVDQNIAYTVEFDQNIPQKKEYLLILLIDFVQQNFYSNGSEYRTYPFTLEGYESIKIDIELPFPKHGKEFRYLIISSPNIKDFTLKNNEWDWDSIYEATYCFSERFFLSDYKYNEADYIFDKNSFEFDKTIDTSCEITKDLEGFMLMDSCRSGELVKFVLGNATNNNICAAVAFLDWEQVPLNENELFKLVKLKDEKIISYDLLMPEVTEDTPYQIFIFSNPFNSDPEISSYVESTSRTIIKQK